MKVYLISNNMLLDGIAYDNGSDLDLIRMVRPLSIDGEKRIQELINKDVFNEVDKIYSSFYSSSISSAKYLKDKLGIDINLSNKLNECKVGLLGSKNIKTIKGLQNHDFNYKLPNGESLMDVGNRLNYFITNEYSSNNNIVLFTHKRIILGYLLKYTKIGYNLDDSLILEYNDKLIYDDTDKDIDIYEITIEDRKIIDINSL